MQNKTKTISETITFKTAEIKIEDYLQVIRITVKSSLNYTFMQ